MATPIPPPLRAVLHTAALPPAQKAALFAATLRLLEEEERAAGGADRPERAAHFRALRPLVRHLWEEFREEARAAG